MRPRVGARRAPSRRSRPCCPGAARRPVGRRGRPSRRVPRAAASGAAPPTGAAEIRPGCAGGAGLTVVGSAGDAGGVGSGGVAGDAGWSGGSSLMRASYATGRAEMGRRAVFERQPRAACAGHSPDVPMTFGSLDVRDAGDDAPVMRDRGFCNQCGTVYAPGDAYCTRCSSRLADVVTHRRLGRAEMAWLATMAVLLVFAVAYVALHGARPDLAPLRRGSRHRPDTPGVQFGDAGDVASPRTRRHLAQDPVVRLARRDRRGPGGRHHLPDDRLRPFAHGVRLPAALIRRRLGPVGVRHG